MLTGWRLKLSKLCFIPQRYILGIMGFFAVVNAYSMRVSLSLAITEMVLPSNSSDVYNPDTCPSDDSNSSSTVKDPDRLYDWDSTTQGLIKGAFYWGYMLTHIPGGVLAEKFGGKYALGLGILSTGVFTMVTPWVIYATDGNWKYVVALRLIEGLGEGTTYPALNTLLAQWVPLGERAKIGTLVYAGGQIGTIISNLISGALIKKTGDWAGVFYLFGGLGILWFIFWTLLCFNNPDSHPFISDEEKSFLHKELKNVANAKKSIPWKSIVTSVPVLALVAAQIGHDWGFYTMVTDLPKYMKEVLKFDVEENGVWSSLPYLVMWIMSMAGGWVCDWLIQRKYMSITVARKFFTTIASLGPAVFIIAASYSGCNRMLSVWMFTVGMGFMGFYYCGMKINGLDLAPNFAGTLMAIINGIGALTGIITPYLTGALTEENTMMQWRTVFWISFGIFNVTSVIYLCFGSGEQQSWNNLEEEEQEKPVEA